MIKLNEKIYLEKISYHSIDFVYGDIKIHNKREICRKLRHDERDSSEIIICSAYSTWGEDIFNHVRGDIACVIYCRHRKKFIILRVPLCSKPLYLIQYNNMSHVSHNIKEIVAQHRNKITRNKRYVEWFVDPASPLAPFETCWSEIYRIPGGYVVQVGESVTFSKCWPSPTYTQFEGIGAGEWSDLFGDVFSRAIQRRLDRDRKCGVLLSGGLDSSFVAGQLVDYMDPPSLSAHSITFRGFEGRLAKKSDESMYIDSVVQNLGIQLIEVNGLQEGICEDIRNSTQMYAHLTLGYNLQLQKLAYKSASSIGVSTLFDGSDGDSVVSHGLERLFTLATTGKYAKLLYEIREGRKTGLRIEHFTRAYVGQAVQHLINCGRGKEIYKLFSILLFHERRLALSIVRHTLAGYGVSRSALRSLLQPGSQRNSDGQDRLQVYKNGVDSNIPKPTRRELHLHSIDVERKERAIEQVVPFYRAGGLELCSPFFDLDVVEVCAAMPLSYKLRHGWPRFVLRKNATNLPDNVRWRMSKGSLGPAFTWRVMNDIDHIREVVEAPGEVGDYIPPSVLKRALNRFVREPDVETYAGKLLYKAYCIKSWLEI